MNIFKKIFLFFLFYTFILKAQILNYNFTSASGSYTSAASSTTIHAAGVDDVLSAAITLPFTFTYNCTPYTQIKVSSNGWMTFSVSLTGSGVNNNLNTGAERLVLAPLWDDLQVGTSGAVRYWTVGTAPNRVFTVEWFMMEWNYSASGPVISFQVRLFETTNRIEFIYYQESANVNSGSASIGINGPTSGDFYSLDGTGATPNASKTFETTNLNTKPATGQIYRWDPVACSSVPAGGTASSAPSFSCSAYTTTLSVTGSGSGCGLTYQWQSAPAPGGPWTNISGATNPTHAINVTATTYFRRITYCGANSGTSSVASASLGTSNSCGFCKAFIPITIPYSANGVSNCSQGNNLSSPPNPCGSSSYYNGEENIYTFTPTTSGIININVTAAASSWLGVMLHQGCPNSGTSTCVGYVQSSSGPWNFCVNVTAGQTYYLVVDSWPSPNCNTYSINVQYSSTGTPTCSLSSYTVAPIPFNFLTFTGSTYPTTDDVLYSAITFFGFQFCYSGQSFQGAYIASNSSLVFDCFPCFPNVYLPKVCASPGGSTGWSISNPAPTNNDYTPMNAILAPWHDIYPPGGGTIHATTLGTAPNRTFVVCWHDVPMFSCTSLLHSSQVLLLENTMEIEIHVANKPLCSSFNNGRAILGLHNYDGTIYVPPVNMTAHNSPTQWTMTNTAYRFTPTCPTISNCAVPLPVEFKALYGQQINNVNYLWWEVPDNNNVEEYYVERSYDEGNFQHIHTTPAENGKFKYEFRDFDFKRGGISYYRVIAKLKSGGISSTSIYPIYSTDNIMLIRKFYPNPVNNQLNIEINAYQANRTSFEFFDIQGVPVKKIEKNISFGFKTYSLDLSDLPPGLYTMKITTPDAVFIEKILRN